MAVSTTILRGWLRVIYAEAVKKSLGLEAALLLSLTGKYESSSGGRIISATSAAGRAVQFIVIEGMGPAECFEGSELLITSSEESRAALVSAGIATPTDAQLFAEMKSRLVAVTEATTDWSGMRLGWGTPVAITAP